MSKTLVHIYVDVEADDFVRHEVERMKLDGLVVSQAAIYRRIINEGIKVLKPKTGSKKDEKK